VKKRYLVLGLVQLLLIFLSGWLRRASWKEIDFDSGAWPSDAQLSLCCLAGWLATIATATWFSAVDKRNRSMIVLFLVLLFPSSEFFLWVGLAF
jgi:hypothetical protein